MSNYDETVEIDGLDEMETINTAIDDLDTESITLIFTGLDRSGSMQTYTMEMAQALNEFKDALTNSKEAEEILIARADFSNSINIGGYKKIADYDTSYSAAGGTALYDVIVEGAAKLKEYMEFLKKEGMRVKAVFAIFTDGEDNGSYSSLSSARDSIRDLNSLEITTAFISFGGVADTISKKIGFKNLLPVASSATELRNAFNCLSKSVIEASKSVVSTQDDFFSI